MVKVEEVDIRESRAVESSSSSSILSSGQAIDRTVVVYQCVG